MKKPRKYFDTYRAFVLPTRFELISMVPETIILSVELRKQYSANISYFTIRVR